ncbi:hypothetical protein LINPERHAP1_LOCUS27653 [Linum perenne]
MLRSRCHFPLGISPSSFSSALMLTYRFPFSLASNFSHCLISSWICLLSSIW